MLPEYPSWEAIGPRCVLGEATVWDTRSQRLAWVDCDQRKLYLYAPETGEVQEVTLPGHPGSYAFMADGRILMAYRTGLSLIDLETGQHDPVDVSGIDFATARFNDGACDRAGRFWVGTMHKAMREPAGGLYRIDPDLSAHLMAEGYIVANGLAFSPDNRILYHTDSRPAVIYAYEYDLERSAISNRQIFADFGGRNERPDGCTVDAEGNVWAAMLGGSRIAVIDPQGREFRSIPLSVSRPTSLCFGGPNLDILFVTSMQYGLTEEELQAQPLAGVLLALSGLGVGLPEPHFSAA